MPSKVMSRHTIGRLSSMDTVEVTSSSSSEKPDTISEILPEHASQESGFDEKAHTHVQQSSLDEVSALPTWRIALILYSLSSGLLLSMMDTSIVATSIYTISLEFNSLANATWVVLAYTLSYLGCAVIVTRLSDVIGRKIAVIGSFTIFIGFSFGCGFAQTLEQLIVCRALQGVGGSGLYALTMVIFPEISPPKLLPFVSSLVGITVAIAGVLGPILGGVITKYSTWRWIFWLNAPCGIVPLILFTIAWPKVIPGYELIHRPWKHTDVIGFVLLLSASILVVFGLQEAGTGALEWSSPAIISSLTIGCVSWVVLVAWEVYASKTHDATIAVILPLRLLKHRVMLAGILSTLLTGFTYLLCIFNLPLRFQIVNLSSSAAAGVHLLPLLVACAVGSALGGALSSRRNNTFWTFQFAAGCILLGSGLLSTLSGSFEIQNKAYGYQVILGFGAGMTLSTMSLMTSLEVDFRDHAVAQGIVAQVRVLGGSLGVAASGAIFHRQAQEKLKGILTDSEIGSLQTSSDVLHQLSGLQLNAVRLVYSDSFDASLRVCTYVAAVAVVVSLATWQPNPPSIARRKAQLEEAVREVVARQAALRQARGGSESGESQEVPIAGVGIASNVSGAVAYE